MPLGRYVCETGGDAVGPAGVRREERDFRITRASSYSTATGIGIYLMTGERVTFTSGPHAGLVYRRVREGFLREIGPDGSDSELRCVRVLGSNF